MPTEQQITAWKAAITKKHYGETVKCFDCPAIDWGLYEVSGRPCIHGKRFLSLAFCKAMPNLPTDGIKDGAVKA